MRKISANLVLPVSSPPLKNGIIRLDARGNILEVIDTEGKLKEESRLEFYSGTIVPGFVLPWVPLKNVAESVRGLDRELSRNGIKGAGIVIQENMAREGGFEQLCNSPLIYHPIIELCPEPGEDEFEVFNRGVDLVSFAWNEFNLSCSLVSCSLTTENSDINRYIREYNASHQHVVPDTGSSKMPGAASSRFHVAGGSKMPGGASPRIPGGDLLNIMGILRASGPDRDLERLLPAFTLDAAARIFEEDRLGSIEPGKQPGLNLISGIDPHSHMPYAKATLRVLV